MHSLATVHAGHEESAVVMFVRFSSAIVALSLGCINGTAPDSSETSISGVYRTPLDTAPCPGEDAETAEARNAIAHVRSLAGLPQLVCDAAASEAARGHCGYVVANGVLTHVQQRGRPGFTGETFRDRLAAASFALDPGGEVIATVGGAEAILGQGGFMNSVYHRAMFLRAETTAFGYGSVGDCATIDFGRPMGATRTEVVVWPPDGATHVPRTFPSAQETPNPVPGSTVVGTPITILGLGGNAVVSFAMQGAMKGVEGVLLTNANDPNKLIRPGEAHFVPRAPLAAKTLYVVTITIDGEPGVTTFTTD